MVAEESSRFERITFAQVRLAEDGWPGYGGWRVNERMGLEDGGPCLGRARCIFPRGNPRRSFSALARLLADRAGVHMLAVPG
jgi:hypothetical protein